MENGGLSEIGIVVRNNECKLVDGIYAKVKADSALVAEALAVREGFKLAIAKDYRKVEIEMDSLIVYSKITKIRKEKQWKIWPIIRDILRLRNQILEKKILWIRRNANKAADWVATQANRGICRFGWVVQQPSSSVYILDKDGLPAPH